MRSAASLIARGLTTCAFTHSAASDQAQTASVLINATRNGETVSLLHTVRGEYAP